MQDSTLNNDEIPARLVAKFRDLKIDNLAKKDSDSEGVSFVRSSRRSDRFAESGSKKGYYELLRERSRSRGRSQSAGGGLFNRSQSNPEFYSIRPSRGPSSNGFRGQSRDRSNSRFRSSFNNSSNSNNNNNKNQNQKPGQ